MNLPTRRRRRHPRRTARPWRIISSSFRAIIKNRRRPPPRLRREEQPRRDAASRLAVWRLVASAPEAGGVGRAGRGRVTWTGVHRLFLRSYPAGTFARAPVDAHGVPRAGPARGAALPGEPGEGGPPRGQRRGQTDAGGAH